MKAGVSSAMSTLILLFQYSRTLPKQGEGCVNLDKPTAWQRSPYSSLNTYIRLERKTAMTSHLACVIITT